MKVERNLITSYSTCNVYEFILSANDEVDLKVLTYGATITSIRTTDKYGQKGEITLCYPTLDELVAKPGPYFGCVAGRFANRIKDGIFSIDGNLFSLPVNNGPNSLHGGISGFDKKVWDAQVIMDEDSVGVRLQYVSNAQEEGYPGTLTVNVCSPAMVDIEN